MLSFGILSISVNEPYIEEHIVESTVFAWKLCRNITHKFHLNYTNTTRCNVLNSLKTLMKLNK